MKKTLLLALLFLISYSSFGQKIRFSDTSNVWHYMYITSGILPPIAWPYRDNYLADTIIRGVNYKQLLHECFSNKVFIREDTILNKVFAIMTVFDTNSSEKLLYDYNLTVGDTFKNVNQTYYVNSIDSVLIAGIWYKVWNFNLYDIHYTSRAFTVIEGIGSISDPCDPITPISGTFEGGYLLTCFDHENVASPITPPFGPYYLDIDPSYAYYFDNNISCIHTPLEAKMIFNKNQPSLVLPNPITESSIIQLPYSITSGMFTITNILGQAISQTTFQNKQELLFGHLVKSRGIYFYRVTDNSSGEIFSGKFVY